MRNVQSGSEDKTKFLPLTFCIAGGAGNRILHSFHYCNYNVYLHCSSQQLQMKLHNSCRCDCCAGQDWNCRTLFKAWIH